MREFTELTYKKYMHIFFTSIFLTKCLFVQLMIYLILFSSVGKRTGAHPFASGCSHPPPVPTPECPQPPPVPAPGCPYPPPVPAPTPSTLFFRQFRTYFNQFFRFLTLLVLLWVITTRVTKMTDSTPFS